MNHMIARCLAVVSTVLVVIVIWFIALTPDTMYMGVKTGLIWTIVFFMVLAGILKARDEDGGREDSC